MRTIQDAKVKPGLLVVNEGISYSPYPFPRCNQSISSGVSIQNPDAPGAAPGGNLVRDILRKAAEGSREAPPPAASSSSAFTGGGHTLGSDEVESSFIPDPNANDPDRLPPAVRVITMWQDGFSVEDGELLRYDTPENRNLLALINNGQAPPSILNVELGQPVELRIMKRLNENYVAPKRSTSAFGGTGNRLGAPVPSTSSSPANIPGSFPADSSDVGRRNTGFEVDRTLPTTRIQLRLADGTSLVCEMNHHHTVQDIRNIINAARLENSARPYTISTTFPNRTLEDNTKTIKEADLLNSVIVQRWA